MTTAVYFLISAFVAGWFTFSDGIKGGDWPKATAIILIAAMWPIAAGAGLGLAFRDALNWFRGRPA